MTRVNQNTAATDGKSLPETGKELPDAPNGVGTAERGATWHLDGRFVYRNKHGAVGYVDGPDSNPGLLALIRVTGPHADAVAAKVHAALIAEASAADMQGSYVLVPREPTHEQLLAYLQWPERVEAYGELTAEIYRTMVAASAEAPDAGLHAEPGYVPLPRNADEAKAMWLVGERWMRDNAPEQIRAPVDSAPIAAALEAAATNLPPSRASTYRRLAAVLREPGFREMSHG